MKQINALIERHQRALEKTEFCKWLGDQNETSLQKLAFAPAMTFFVLGFKDILDYIKIPNPQSSIDHELNTHCEEDSDHWLWFIEDLEKLGLDLKHWGGSTSDIFRKVWSDEYKITRKMVYNTISKIQKYNNPELSLVTLEVLESAFAAFIKNLNVLTQKNNIYEKLTYFGAHHFHEENSHELGSWSDSQLENEHLNKYVLDKETALEANKIVNEMFSEFEEMFNCWHLAQSDFVLPQEIALHKTFEIIEVQNTIDLNN